MYRKTYHDFEEIYLHLYIPRLASDFPEVEETSSRAARYLFPGDHLSTLSSPPTGEVLSENAELPLQAQSCSLSKQNKKKGDLPSLRNGRAAPSNRRSILSENTELCHQNA